MQLSWRRTWHQKECCHEYLTATVHYLLLLYIYIFFFLSQQKNTSFFLQNNDANEYFLSQFEIFNWRCSFVKSREINPLPKFIIRLSNKNFTWRKYRPQTNCLSSLRSQLQFREKTFCYIYTTKPVPCCHLLTYIRIEYRRLLHYTNYLRPPLPPSLSLIWLSSTGTLRLYGADVLINLITYSIFKKKWGIVLLLILP